MLKNPDLIVDPKYLEFIPRPSKERYNEMKRDIFHKGQLIAIIVNQDHVILDGHTRYQICQELQMKPKIEKRTFDDPLEEERFVYAINVKRRDLEKFVHIELSLKIHEIDQILGKQKRNAQLKQNESTVYLTSDKREKHDTLKLIAKETKTSRDAVAKVKKILGNATPKEIQDLREGKDGVSVNKSYKRIKKQEKKEKRQDQIKKIQAHLPENAQLFNQPFQQNKIKDNSVSLILTDPPYKKEHLYLYEELAQQAIKVLKDGGSLLCYIGHYAIGTIISMMEKHGLKFHWPIAVIHSGPSSAMWDRRILVGYKLMLWFTKGKYDGEFVRDTIKSEFQGKELHEWAKSTVESDYYIQYLTLEDEIVYDPFLGQGTCGVSAVKLGRQFIGSEIDKGHFENAQRLIAVANKKQKGERSYQNDT